MGQGTAMTGTARKKALRQELRRRMLAHTDAQVAALSEAVARQVFFRKPPRFSAIWPLPKSCLWT